MSYKGFDLQGKVAVVVGGTSGISRVIGRELAEAGADVIPTGRRSDMVEAAAKEIESLGRRSLRIACDVHDRASLQRVLEVVIKEFGNVDILAAGITKREPFLDVNEEQWREVVETNLTGAFHSCQIFGRYMVEQGYGKVINIASLGSYLGLSGVAAYAASKAGLASLTRPWRVRQARCLRLMRLFMEFSELP